MKLARFVCAASIAIVSFAGQSYCWEAVGAFTNTGWGSGGADGWAANTPILINQYMEEYDPNTGLPLYATIAIRLNQTTLKRELIVINNPADPRLAPVVAVLKDAYLNGKKLKVLGVNYRSVPSTDLNLPWMGYTNTIVYRIVPGDKVAAMVQ